MIVAGIMILKWPLNKRTDRGWTGIIWLKTTISDGPLWTLKRSFGLHKIPRISWLAQDLHLPKKTLLQGLNFSLVSVLQFAATAVINPCYNSMQAKALITHRIQWYSLPSFDLCVWREKNKNSLGCGSALCTSGKTSHKDSFGLPRHCALHHAAQCQLLNKTTHTVCRQGYTAWRRKKCARGKKFCDREICWLLYGRNHDSFCPEMADSISEVFKMES